MTILDVTFEVVTIEIMSLKLSLIMALTWWYFKLDLCRFYCQKLSKANDARQFD